MFVTKSPGSRILMLVINNHYSASPRPPMISSYVRIFVRTQGPGSVGLRGEKKSQRLHKLSPGVSLSQSEASINIIDQWEAGDGHHTPVTGRHIVPRSSWHQTMARVVARLVTTPHSSQPRSNLSHLSHSSIQLSAVKPLKTILDFYLLIHGSLCYECDLIWQALVTNYSANIPQSGQSAQSVSQTSRDVTNERPGQWAADQWEARREWDPDRGCDNCYAQFCSLGTEWWPEEMAIREKQTCNL